jgi:thiamine kinase-like enzyme
MSITIEQVVAQIPDWQGKRVEIRPLSGGLTNTNYRVEADGVPYVVRLPGASTELLAVDRANEYHNTQAAAEAGAGARVVHFLPDVNVMVLEFIEGETMSIARLTAAGMPTRMAQSIKKLHSGPRFLHDFNMFRLAEYYLKLCHERGVKIPEGYQQYMPQVGRIEQAMAKHPLATVPCHNDLLAENYIDDGKILRLIDFEYSGNNDPTFELGNTCQEQLFDEARIAEMCAAYFGGARPDRLARMKLNMIMSDAGWTLWAAIQAQISTIEFDFWGWAAERWARAAAKMDAPEFEVWLGEV